MSHELIRLVFGTFPYWMPLLFLLYLAVCSASARTMLTCSGASVGWIALIYTGKLTDGVNATTHLLYSVVGAVTG